MKESTRKALELACTAVMAQVNAEIKPEDWKYHSERVWIARTKEHLVAIDVSDKVTITFFQFGFNFILDEVSVATKKDPLVANQDKGKLKKKKKRRDED